MWLILIQRPLATPEDVYRCLVWQQNDGLHVVILTCRTSQGSGNRDIIKKAISLGTYMAGWREMPLNHWPSSKQVNQDTQCSQPA